MLAYAERQASAYPAKGKSRMGGSGLKDQLRHHRGNRHGRHRFVEVFPSICTGNYFGTHELDVPALSKGRVEAAAILGQRGIR